MIDEPSVLLSDNAAAALIGISRTTFWRRVNDGTMPKPVKLGGSTRWYRKEVVGALEALGAKRGLKLKF